MSKEKTQELREQYNNDQHRCETDWSEAMQQDIFTKHYVEWLESRLLSPQWIPAEQVEQDEKMCGVEVLGYSPDWICEDYNPKGTRICFYDAHGWHSAYWNNTHDYYQNDEESKPTHYQIITEPINK
jgi:hypothetical protein